MELVVLMLYQGNVIKCASALDVNPSTIYRWYSGSELRQSQLIALHNEGLDIGWLFNPEDHDLTHMFNNTEKGKERLSHFMRRTVNEPQGMEYHQSKTVPKNRSVDKETLV